MAVTDEQVAAFPIDKTTRPDVQHPSLLSRDQLGIVFIKRMVCGLANLRVISLTLPVHPLLVSHSSSLAPA